MEKYEYVSCDGGPHILLPLELSTEWKGHKINLFNPLDPKSDYGRACKFDKWGIIDVGGSPALVLADPPMSACARKSDTNYLDIFVLQGWQTDDLDSLLDRAAAQTPADSFVDTGAVMKFRMGEAVLLFAGDEPGKAVFGETRVTMAEGDYRLLTSRYKGTGVEEVEIYRLIRSQPPSAGDPTPR